MIRTRIKPCVVCGNLLEATLHPSGLMTMPRLVCSIACRKLRMTQYMRERYAARKLLRGPTVRRPRKCKGPDPAKYAARKQRSNEVRRQRRLVVQAVRELGLLETLETSIISASNEAILTYTTDEHI